MNKRKNLLILSILSIFVISIPLFYLSGCSVFSAVGIPPSVKTSGGYKSALKEATRKADIYNKLNTVMYIRATYFDKPFIYAYAKERANYYMLSGKAFERKLRASYYKNKKYAMLLVSVYTPRKSYNDLNSNRSIWMVYLVNNEGESVMPLSIKLSRKKRTVLKKFFPYVTDWSRQYIMKFPKYYDKTENKPFLNRSVKWIELVITGVNGKAVLKWDLRNAF